MWNDENVAISKLLGKTIKLVEQKGDDELYITLTNDEQFKMYHDQNCCENVTIDDICGDLNDLIGQPLIRAEERSSSKNPPGIAVPDYQDSYTWTFYELATVKGSVTIRWYGSSNGYYSEEVSFIRTAKPDTV